MAGALENRGKNRGLALAQKKAKEKNKTGALTLRGQDRDEKNRGGLAGGIGYVAGNLGLGLANVGEGILDISMAAGDLLQGDTDMAKYRFLNNMSGNAQKRLQEDYNPNGAMKLAGDVASGIGNSLTFLIPYAGPYLAAAGYMGMGVSSAAERTGDVGAKELGYGVVSGSMEFLMDKFIGASGRAYKSIGASITRKMGREAAEAGAKATAKLAGKSFGKAVLTETLKGAAGEALEEASQEALDPLLLRLFNIDENAKLDWKNVAYAGLVGGLSGGLMTAGPAAINYKSAASTGKSIRESGETAEFLEHARLVVKGAQRKQANLTAKKDAAKAAKETKTVDGTDTAKAEKTKGGIGTFIQGRRDAKASRRVAQLAETVQKNLTAYEGYLNKADKTAKELEISDAILGEMRGNVFLLENAALLESYEEAILELSDEDKAVLVAEVNARAKASGAKKTDYTVEDLNKDTDGILAGVAGNLLIRDNYGRYLRGNQEAKAADTSESPAEAAESEEAASGEEVEAEPSKSAEEAPEVKKEAAPKRKGTVTVSDGMKPSKDFSDTQYAAYKAAEILSGSTGMDIEIHRDLTRDGKSVNGYYDQGTKVLHVNINAMRDGKHIALYTLGHEATHYIKDWSPEKFNVLADFVAKQMGTDMQTAVNEKLSSLFRLGLLKNLTAEQASELAREEVVADGMELIFTDGKVLEELARTDKSLWQKIRDWFFDMIGQIRNSYRGLNQASKTAQVLRESMETLDEVERLFTEGVRDAGERAATTGVETRTEGEKVYSFTPADFEKPITLHDIEVLRSIGRKSINAFTSADIEKALKWAYKFYQEMGTKSPFFRAWFGDWRAYDTSTVKIVSSQSDTRGKKINKDTGWEINRSAKISGEKHASAASVSGYTFLPYIDGIIENAILLDSTVSDNENVNSVMFHSMYAVVNDGIENNIIKLTVEELKNPGKDTERRAYKLINIEKYQPSAQGSPKLTSSLKTDTDISIADLFAFVKQYDKEFSPKPVNKLMLNDDGTPKVFYHGTNAEFTQFKESKDGALGKGIYFAQNEWQAKEHGKRVVPVFLNLKNPYIAQYPGIDTDKLKAQGYDGVFAPAPGFMVAFDPKRIKSATDNIGTFDGTNPDIRYSIDDSGEVSESEAADNQAALEKFGTTTDFEQAGFAMADGRMLKLSQYGQRGVQHRVIEGIYRDTKGDEAIARFIQNGNVRISAASPGIEISAEKPLTTNQLNVISRFASKSLAGRGSFYLDITGRDGESIASVAYDDRQSAAAIVEDIKDYYKRGRVPEESRYLYSIDDSENVSENAADTNVGGTEEDFSENELTDRDLLLDMAEKLVGTEEENKILSDYKAKMNEQKSRQKKLDELTDEMRELQSVQMYGEDPAKRSEAAKRLNAIYKEMGTISNEIAKTDRRIVEISGMKVIRNLLTRERLNVRDTYKTKYETMYNQRKEATETTELRRQTRRIYNRLYRMLAHPTKTKNVPYEMQGITADALRAANMDLDALERLEQLEEQLSKLEREGVPDPDKIAKKEKEIKKQEEKVGSMKEQIQVLVEIFEKSKEIKTGVGANVYSDDALAILKNLQTEIGNVSIRNANREQLASLKKFYETLYTRINNANKAFATEKAANIDEMSTKANTQVKNAKDLKYLSPTGKEWAAMAGIRKYFWKNMKPLTVFEAIGSDELMSIFKRVLGGEDVWITDILEAKKVLDEAKKEFGYNKWNLKERREVTTADGSKVSLTLGEMMSLYAYMFREQAEEHLSVGGFVFAPDAKAIEKFKGSKALYKTHLNDQTPHRMRKEDIAKMSEMLTQEQRAYAKTVQEYLTKLGAKGNEVSRKLYGIELFKETAYFPIKSSHDYIETSTGPSGDPNIKSRGTFKETVPGAGNPIVLEDFMEVVGNHVNTMATYHAFVLPVEDLTRVWNYTPVNIKRDENGRAILDKNGMPVADTEGAAGYNSLKAEITKKYGKEANDYILQLLRDLNGGARRESASSILDKGITAFKRSATMLSLSTIVQQPTSIIRAMAYVDAKYFKGASFVPWETVKKYAPVAAIKEVGGHDTNTGARTVDYINAKEYDSIKDAVKAAVKPEIYGGDPNVRAEAFGWLTGKADEVSWRYMFGAIVNEQAERLGKPKNSEEVLTAAGKRFAEVVRHTQVYDSTLTRSEYMRSKDGLMKMATAFGAEPTTVVSMAVDALIKKERGDKTFFRKSAAGIAFSIIANAAVVSLIYAMRDDDEDETIPEKYVQSLTSELIEGFNPFEYLPIARDIMSMFKGYEIERSDMALIGNLMEQVELITSSKRSVPDKIFGVTGAVSAFFGLPVTNVYRDLKGLAKTGQSFIDAEEQTGAGLGYAMGDAVRGQFNLFSKIFGAESGNAYELYKAFVSGDTAHYNRVAARYESEAAVEQALRKELRERDRRIGEAAEARMAGELDVYESIIEQIEGEGIFERNMIIRAINNEINSLKDDAEQESLVPKDEEAAAEDAEEVLSLYSTKDLNEALERGDREDFSWIYQTLVTGKTEQGKTEAQAKAAVKSSVTAYWKKRYIEAWAANDTAEIKRIQSILQSTGLYGSRNDVAKLGQDWVKAYAAGKK